MWPAISLFFSKFGAIIQFIIPLLKIIWKLFNPKIKKLLDILWDITEQKVEEELKELEIKHTKKKTKPKRKKQKAQVFNSLAKRKLKQEGISISQAELNLARELIHYTKTKKQKRKKRKTCIKN